MLNAERRFMSYPRVASFKTADAFRQHLRALGVGLDFDDTLESGPSSPLGQPFAYDGVTVGNRFCVLPMEGWDGTRDGEPSDLTRRRWSHFGRSGAKLIWGGEAVAVRQDGRANPNQLLLTPRTQRGIAGLRETLIDAHRERFGPNADGDLYVGLQLTHSGRYARPAGGSEPLAAYHHPLLDRRFTRGVRVMSDEELDRLVDQFVAAARLAWDAGFAFVDIKHCHGYLGHELLSAHERRGRYGGPLENRTRFLQSVVAGIRATMPGLGIAVRLSAFDTVPFHKDDQGRGAPEISASAYRSAFGVLRDGMDEALADARQLLHLLTDLGIRWVCITAGSPYYNPHVQRPALFPPSDGYEPPEDPLVGVARQIDATARLKAAFPSLAVVGSAYSYLQEWLPNVAQRTVREGLTDFVGIGRMILAYPDLPADVLAGRTLERKRICRTFSDCTTGPRLGLVSGCFPLDPVYAGHPDAKTLKMAKKNAER
jgi:2,4-dienoyl-CoA reductase-like NADH-dependent reductase (Old Yellow Enzyme family)